MCTVLLPPGVNPIAVKHIISYTISYIIAYHIPYHILYHSISYHTTNVCWNFQLHRSAVPKKSTFAQLVKHLSAIYATIIVLTTALHWTLSWARWIHFAPSHPIYSPLQARLQKREATISFVMSACPSVRPHGTTRLPLDGFSWNLIFAYFFSKICQQNSSFI